MSMQWVAQARKKGTIRFVLTSLTRKDKITVIAVKKKSHRHHQIMPWSFIVSFTSPIHD
jgi:hypothetical protein